MPWTHAHRAAGAFAATGLAAVAVALATAPASARVLVDPPGARSGGYTTLAFSVSTERADASTTKVEIRFPADHAMPGLTTERKPGWDVTVDRIRAEATPTPSGGAAGEPTQDPVSAVTWTASSADAAIGPGSFEQFRVSVGPLPSDVDRLLFEARQTYSDGEVVSWDQQPDPAAARPAPTLALAADTSADPAASPATVAGAMPQQVPTPEAVTLSTETVSAETTDGTDRSTRVALGLSAGGVLILGTVAATAFARRRHGAPTVPGA